MLNSAKIETANRFARDLIVQETGHRMLSEQGIEIIAADSPGAFVDGPTATLVRQVLGAVAQFDKAMTVAKFRLAREPQSANAMASAKAESHTPRSAPRSSPLAEQLHSRA